MHYSDQILIYYLEIQLLIIEIKKKKKKQYRETTAENNK